MALHVRSGSGWSEALGLFVKDSGSWKPVDRAYVNVGGVWKQFYQNEVTVTLSSTGAPISLKSLFNSSDWNNAFRTKRVIIPPGVEIGTNINAYAMFATPTGDGQAGSFAGDLIVDNYGTMSGIGGVANGGVGGSVILGNLPGQDGRKMIVNNFGTIRAGGGGGGIAGNGGAGQFTFTEGPFFSGAGGVGANATYAFMMNNGFGNPVWWAGVQIASATGAFSAGGWNYAVGAYQGTNGSNVAMYAISRSQPQATSGGVAGAAGRGRGYDGAPATGAAAVAGGTNAGASGKSGDGGEWGASGQAGGNGAAGNAGSGTSGSAAGLAGFYLNGAANVQLNNYGTLQGRVA